MIKLDREWYPDDDLETSQSRVVKQLKSIDTSKHLGNVQNYIIDLNVKLYCIIGPFSSKLHFLHLIVKFK